MTVKAMKAKLDEFPDDYLVDLYSDENVDGISVSNPRGRITTVEEVIEYDGSESVMSIEDYTWETA